MNWENQDKFLKSVKNHTMTVIFDNGLNRHIRFQNESDNDCWFEIITWNNSLCINGDMGTYVFSRTSDMFNFFRMGGGWNNESGEHISINPSYWHEKLRADSRFEPAKKFSFEMFEEYVRDRVDSYCEQYLGESDKKALWEEIKLQVLSEDNNNCARAYDALYNFTSYEIEDFEFTDIESSYWEKFSYHYLWCLCAIVWGIKQYDGLNNFTNTLKEAGL